MKKLLSVLLTLVVAMSVLGIVPVSAATYAACPLPYAFVDFEDGLSPFATSGTQYVSTVVDSGIAERGKVAQITVSGNVNGGASMKNGSANITTPISIGDKITVSMWIKSNVKLTKGQFSIIMTGMTDKITEGTMTASSYNCWTFPFDPTSTEWQYVSTTVTSTFSSNETTAFSYRMGDTSGLNFKEGETSKSESITDRIYQIDDFEMKIEKATQLEKKNFPYEENIALTDSESWAGITAASVHSSDVLTAESGTEADPAPAGNKYLRIDHNGTKCLGIDIELKEKLRSNHMYIMSFKTRGTDLSNSSIATSQTEVTETNGNKVKKYLDMGYRQMVYQVMYETDDVVSGAINVNSPNGSATSSTLSGAKVYKNFYFYNTKLVNVDSEHPGYDPNGYANWFTVTIPILSDKLNVEEFLSSSAKLRVNFWLYNQSGQGLGNFDFDDIKVLDLGPMSNGGFDYTAGSSYLVNGGGGSANNYGVGWKFDAGIKNWGTTTGSSAYTFLQGSSRIPTEQSDDSKRAILYGQYTNDAEMYKYVPMTAGSIYTIKGYVRGQKGNNNKMTKGRVRLVVDYTGDTFENEVYDVSKLGTNGVIYGDWVEFVDGYNMEKPVTVSVDLTDLDFIEGKEATTGIMPRTPKVIVDFDEEWEENVNAPGTVDHTVYMDGFTITREASKGYPFVVAESATMSALGVVSADYAFSTSFDAETEDKSVYKLIADGRYSGTFYSKNAILVPEAIRTASELVLEIVPVTSDGYIGEAVQIAIEALPAVEGITLSQEEGNVTIATDKALTEVKLIFVSYDSFGKMIDWQDVDITMKAGETDTFAPVDLKAGAATKAMLWEDIVNCVPIAQHIEW